MGDIVDYGPDPAACIDFLRERQVFRARGNHDDAVAFHRDCRTPHGPCRHLSVSVIERLVYLIEFAKAPPNRE